MSLAVLNASGTQSEGEEARLSEIAIEIWIAAAAVAAVVYSPQGVVVARLN